MTSEQAAGWLALLRRLGGGGDIAGVGARLTAAYAERHRSYHDATHLAEVLHHVNELAAYAADADVVRLAAWFHDAVYDPGRSDNEQCSSDLARDALARLGLPDPLVEEVVRLVRLTASHDPMVGDANGAVLCDADLAVLAADPHRYAAYAQGVRREYGAVDDADFAAGRARVLRALLDRPELYSTPEAKALWSAAARRNVQAELDALGSR